MINTEVPRWWIIVGVSIILLFVACVIGICVMYRKRGTTEIATEDQDNSNTTPKTSTRFINIRKKTIGDTTGPHIHNFFNEFPDAYIM